MIVLLKTDVWSTVTERVMLCFKTIKIFQFTLNYKNKLSRKAEYTVGGI